jgi:hypothetical protein
MNNQLRIFVNFMLLSALLLLPGSVLAQGNGDDDSDDAPPTVIELGPDGYATVTVPDGWVVDASSAPIIYSLANTQDTLEVEQSRPGDVGAVVALFPVDDGELSETLEGLIAGTTQNWTLLSQDDLNFEERRQAGLRSLTSNEQVYTDDTLNYTVYAFGVEDDVQRVAMLYLSVSDPAEPDATPEPTDTATEDALTPAEEVALLFASVTLGDVPAPQAGDAPALERQEFTGLLGVPQLSVSLPPTWVASITEDGAALDLASSPAQLDFVQNSAITDPASVTGAGVSISILDKATFGELQITLLDLWNVLGEGIATDDRVSSSAPAPTFVGGRDALRADLDAPAGAGSITIIETDTAYLLVIALGNPPDAFDVLLRNIVGSIAVVE